LGAKPLPEETWVALFGTEARSKTLQAEGAVFCPRADFSGFTVNKRLIDAAALDAPATGELGGAIFIVVAIA
jgi:hypothetical protein